jgi:hypothetical protein
MAKDPNDSDNSSPDALWAQALLLLTLPTQPAFSGSFPPSLPPWPLPIGTAEDPVLPAGSLLPLRFLLQQTILAPFSGRAAVLYGHARSSSSAKYLPLRHRLRRCVTSGVLITLLYQPLVLSLGALCRPSILGSTMTLALDPTNSGAVKDDAATFNGQPPESRS